VRENVSNPCKTAEEVIVSDPEEEGKLTLLLA
jgi:hypothetical protein